jgi:hypothetical protein
MLTSIPFFLLYGISLFPILTLCRILNPEPVFVNVYGAQESIPPAYVAGGPVRQWISRTCPPGWESIPMLLKRFKNSGSGLRTFCVSQSLRYTPPFLAITNYPVYTAHHRVGRVISFFSSRRNWDSPNPSSAGECATSPRFWGEGHTRWRERGWESHNRRGDIRCGTLYIYI